MSRALLSDDNEHLVLHVFQNAVSILYNKFSVNLSVLNVNLDSKNKCLLFILCLIWFKGEQGLAVFTEHFIYLFQEVLDVGLFHLF